MSPGAGRGALRVLPAAVSALVLAALIWEASQQPTGALGAQLRPGWLAAALAVKGVSALLHELRVHQAFVAPRPPLGAVLRVGFAAGALNLVLPARGGDLAAIGLLVRHAGAEPGAAAAAVAMGSLFEAMAFAVCLLAAVGSAAPALRAAGGDPAGALHLATWGLLGAVAAGAVLVRVRPRRGEQRVGGARGLLRGAAAEAGALLARPAALAGHAALSLAQVGTMILSFALCFPAVGLAVEAPVGAAALVLLGSAFASVVLPAGYGAGPAAAAVALLGPFGVGPGDALVWSAAYWLVSQAPAVALGLPAWWSLRAQTKAPRGDTAGGQGPTGG